MDAIKHRGGVLRCEQNILTKPRMWRVFSRSTWS